MNRLQYPFCNDTQNYVIYQFIKFIGLSGNFGHDQLIN